MTEVHAGVRQLTDSFGAASGLLVVDVQSVIQRHDCFFKLQPTSQFPVATNTQNS